MKILQKIWDWLFRLICFGFNEDDSHRTEEAETVDGYSKRLEEYRAAAQAVIADHYRVQMLLEQETQNLQEIEALLGKGDQPSNIRIRYQSTVERVQHLQNQALQTGTEASKALNDIEIVSSELAAIALKMQDAGTTKRAAELRQASENWRLEKELGLNKQLAALEKMEKEARQAKRKAELTSESNDIMFGDNNRRNLEE